MLTIIKTLTNELSQFNTVEKIVLFGSRARGDNEARSDIDLAVFCPKASHPEWLKLVKCIEEAKTLYFIDFIRLDEASQTFREKILKEGKVLYERSESQAISR